MNNAIDTGGMAYPSGKSEDPGYENSLPYHEGMTLRDHFAGLALQSILASANLDEDMTQNQLAEIAYEQADEMISARKENP